MISTFLSRTINKLLQLDPVAKEKLKCLEHKVLTLQCVLGVPITLQCTADHEGVIIEVGNERAYDTKIIGTPLQLFRVGILTATRDAFQLDGLTIEGDMELADAWLRLFREADIDIEEMLARVIGDVPANKTGQLFNQLKSFAMKNISSFETSLNEYLHEESDWFPDKVDLHNFFDEVDKIRLDTDRLEAKIALLQKEFKDSP